MNVVGISGRLYDSAGSMKTGVLHAERREVDPMLGQRCDVLVDRVSGVHPVFRPPVRYVVPSLRRSAGTVKG